MKTLMIGDKAMEKTKENKICPDALLWIGNAPGKYQTVDDFVKETQLRGCCRQLPLIPRWMKSGITKLFLTHRDVHKTAKRGSIFGYFVLHRIEIITKHKVAQFLSEPKNLYRLWPQNVEHYFSCINRWKEEKCSSEEIKRRLKEKIKVEHVPNVAKGQTSEKPSSEEYNDDNLDLIEDILDTLLNECFSWPNEEEDYNIIDFIKDILDILFCFHDEDPTKGEGHRMCSLRKGPGSVYAVDALCAAVHDVYRQLLQQYLLSESKKSGKSQQEILKEIQVENEKAWKKWLDYKKSHKWNIQDLIEQYRGPFYESVKKLFGIWKLKYPIDPRLIGKASNFGELIVFKRPFPILERSPQAAFKGVCRIDGDKLIDQIAIYDKKRPMIVTLYYCGKSKCPEEMPIKTKEQLTTCLAQELHLSRAYAGRFLDKISQKAKEQLQHFGYYKLPGIGTIRVHGKKDPKIKLFPAKGISGIGTLHPYKAISEISIIRPSSIKLQKITKKSVLAEWLAEELDITKACAARFLDELSMIASEQITNFGRFRLPGVGTIYI